MVNIKWFLPDEASLNLLLRLQGPLTVSGPTNMIGGMTSVHVRSPTSGVVLSSQYHDVVFKFEIFELRVEPLVASPKPLQRKLGSVVDWDNIQCLVRFEWDRPAEPGELPAGYDQIVGERGPRKQIPTNASNIGVSMVGIAFSNSTTTKIECAIALDKTDGNLVIFESDLHAISALVTGCDLVKIGDLVQNKEILA